MARVGPHASIWRVVLLEGWQAFVSFYWIPIACIGVVVAMRSGNIFLEIILLHLATMLYAAFAYIGEIRYRVPYDLLINIVFILGLGTICTALRNPTSSWTRITDHLDATQTVLNQSEMEILGRSGWNQRLN